MNLTWESEYALRGLVRLGNYPPHSAVSLAAIAEAERLPPLHDQLNDVLSELTLADFIDDSPGASDSRADPEVRDV